MENVDLKEQAIIDVRKQELKDYHMTYLQAHPELEQILNDFTSEVLMHKPADVIDFAKDYFSKFNPNPVKTRPLAVVGPSGVGKSTLIGRLMAEHPENFEFSVSCTTRQPREGEIKGKHYHFITREEFQKRVEDGEFIEWAEVHNNLYGTRITEVQDIASRGKVCILDIDVQGVNKIHQYGLEFNRIFLMPKSMKQLEERLRARGEIDENVLRTRLRNAQVEIEAAKSSNTLFTDFVTNDNIEQAIDDFYYFVYRYYEFLKVRE